ncbi:MAG TPA: ABC transporter ATP-binding protein [Terriglobia bacterium]|nr:ABC transporter ATP-binding protein [Terriglobia bacterium]
MEDSARNPGLAATTEGAGEASEVVLRAERLSKIFHSARENVVVLEDLSFEVRKGEFMALVGESGAGKTTLLYLLAALDSPSSGEVYFGVRRVGGFSAVEKAIYRGRELGFVWQMHYLLPEFSALENIVLPQLIAGRDFGAARCRARELLEEVGLGHVAERRAGELSGGEQQRVALGRALANGPAVLLADEPTGSLDQHTAGQVIELLQRLHRVHGLTSVLATHNLELAGRADRTLRLVNGRFREAVA